MALTPVLAMATLAAGLRLGASRSRLAAIVYGAPSGKGRSRIAWQVVTVRVDRGVSEAVAVPGLVVHSSSGGREATWRGSSNQDGVAEIALDVGDGFAPFSLSVASGEDILAHGIARWDGRAWGPDVARAAWVQPSRAEGPLSIAVAVGGGKLTPGFATDLWVRVTDAATRRPLPVVSLTAEPEPGLELEARTASTCADGWAKLRATPQIHVVGLGLKAAAADGRGADWFGALPVALGASWVDVAPVLPENAAHTFDVVVPTVRPVVYAEVDDTTGRVFAAALPAVAAPGGMGHAAFEAPPLARGDYWLVTSGDPRGAESLDVASIARPFRVAAAGGTLGCGEEAAIATRAALPFKRWVALDGTIEGNPGEERQRRAGRLLAFGSLLVASFVEVLLILRTARRARAQGARLSAALAESDGPLHAAASTSPDALGLLIALLLAVLGFAFVLALLTLRV